MKPLYKHLAAICLLVSMQAAFAQNMDTSPPAQNAFPDKEDSKSETRRPSWFHSPKKETSAEQMAYAKDLLAKGKVRKARKQFLALVYKWQAAPEAAEAQAMYASLLEQAGKHEKAFKEYQYLMDHYVGSFVFEDILEQQFALANSVRTQKRWRFWGLFPGVESPERALDLFDQITKNSPGWERTPEARFYIAAIEEKRERYQEAADDFGIVVLRHRRSPLAADAAFRRGHCLYLEVQEQPRDESAYREALSALVGFTRDFPSHEGVEAATGYIEELKEKLAAMHFEIALYYDTICHRNDSAILAYQDFIRTFPSSELSVTAHKRIEELRLAGDTKPK
jgi:outer membrane protein assembly factor BamD (BamD/ComL family)